MKLTSKNVKKKVFAVLTAIHNASEIVSKGGSVYLVYDDEMAKSLNKIDFVQIVQKLEKDEKIIEILRVASWAADDTDLYYFVNKTYENAFEIKLKTKFKKYFEEFAIQVSKSIHHEDGVYWIKFTDDRRILINDLFQVARLNFDSDNEKIFKFLYENPNKLHNWDDLKEKIDDLKEKDLHVLVRDLNLNKSLKIFFDVSKNSICFKNPISKGDLEKSGIDYLQILPK